MQSLNLARSLLLPFALTLSVRTLPAQDPGETWQLQHPVSNPGERAEYMTAFLGTSGKSILFGGQSLGGNLALSGTFSWDGRNWDRISTQGAPAPRARAAMAYDPIRERIVLFGGVDENAGFVGRPLLYGDTWEFDGQRWTRLSPATSPPPLVGPDMAWDPIAQKLLLYGGGTTFLENLQSDTWLFDGTTWEKLTPGQTPGGLKDHRMVTDTVRNRIVLFGGIDSEKKNVFVTVTNNLWEWVGGNWIFVSRTFLPAARRSFGMAFDSIRGLSVVTYGSNASGGRKLADTWKWDGVSWSENMFLDPRPQARGLVRLTENPNTGRMMLYGGDVAIAQPGETTETWEFFGPSIASAGPFGSGCQGSNQLAPTLLAGGSSRPRLGTDFRLVLSNLPLTQGIIPVGFWGLSNTIWRDTHFSLPDDLGWIGMPGCKLLVSLDNLVPLSMVGSSADWVLTIPQSNSLLGLEFFLQGLVLDPNANALGVTLSNGVAAALGSQ